MLIFGPDLLFGFLPPEIEKLYLHRCRSMCLLKSLWFKFLGPNSLNNCCLSKSQCTIPSWHGWFLKKKDGSFEAPRFYPLKAWVAFLWGGQSSREINAAILNSEVPWEPVAWEQLKPLGVGRFLGWLPPAPLPAGADFCFFG